MSCWPKFNMNQTVLCSSKLFSLFSSLPQSSIVPEASQQFIGNALCVLFQRNSRHFTLWGFSWLRNVSEMDEMFVIMSSLTNSVIVSFFSVTAFGLEI